MIQRVRRLALIVGFALLGTFITVMTVHYMLPMDPLEPAALIDYRTLFGVVFVVICGLVGIAHTVGQRQA